MKIIDATQKLINYFIKYDSINDEQIYGLIPDKEDKHACYTAFALALDEMEKNQIVSSKMDEVKIPTGKNDELESIKITTWVLKRPLHYREQVVLIDGMTALRVSAVVNNFTQMQNKGQIMCNPLQIVNMDVLALLDIIAIYAKQNIKEQEKVKTVKGKTEEKENE